MPRTQSPPKYRQHKASGRPIVTFSRRDVWLPGEYNSLESRRSYDWVVALWLSNGRQLPDELPPWPSTPTITPNDSAPSTVNDLILAFWRHCQEKYGSRSTARTRLSEVRCAMRPVKKLFGDRLVEDFGPRALKRVREAFIEAGWCRKVVNERVRLVVRAFRWAVSEQLIDESQHRALCTVEPVEAADQLAPDSKKVLPVPGEVVEMLVNNYHYDEATSDCDKIPDREEWRSEWVAGFIAGALEAHQTAEAKRKEKSAN
jgi:hypothetical protein